MSETACSIVGQDDASSARAEAVVKMADFRIERGVSLSPSMSPKVKSITKTWDAIYFDA